MADIDLAAVERELRARHDELEERLAALARPPERGSQVGFGKRIGDGTTEAVSRLTDVGVGGSLELSEARVARALAKLAEGSYGVCDGCGEPIAPARLAAAPESVLCIECARRAGADRLAPPQLVAGGSCRRTHFLSSPKDARCAPTPGRRRTTALAIPRGIVGFELGVDAAQLAGRGQPDLAAVVGVAAAPLVLRSLRLDSR